MPVEAFLMFGELKADTDEFRATLKEADAKLEATRGEIDRTEKKARSLGDTSAVTARQFEKLNERIGEQQARLQAVGSAFERGQVSSKQMASALSAVERAAGGVNDRLKDVNARIADSTKNKVDTTFAQSQKQRQGFAERSALQQQRIDAQVNAQKQRLAQQAAQFQVKAQQAVQRAAQQASIAQQRIAAQSSIQQQRLAQQASQFQIRMSEQARRRFETEQRRQAAAAEKAAKAASMSWDKFRRGLGNIGSGISNFGKSLSVGVTAPLTAAGYALFQAGANASSLRNQLFAATGSIGGANSKLAELRELARTSAGVLSNNAVALYGFLKPLKLADPTIDNVIKALGRLKLANDTLDPQQFTRNMTQLFTQGFERTDLKEAVGAFPRFGEIMQQAFKLSSPDLATIAKELKGMQAAGKLTLNEFMKGFADAVESDANLANLDDTIWTKLEKSMARVRIAFEPFGEAVAEAFLKVTTGAEVVLTKVGRVLADLSPMAKTATVVLAAFAASIGPAMVVIGKVISGIAAFAAALATLGGLAAVVPILAKVTAVLAALTVLFAPVIAAVAALAAAWYTNFGGIADFTKNIWNRIVSMTGSAVGDIGERLTQVYEWWLNTWSNLMTAIKPASEAVRTYISGWIMSLNEVVNRYGGEMVAWWQNNWPRIQDIASQVMERITAVVQNGLTVLNNFWTSHGGRLMGFLSSWWNTVSSLYESRIRVIANVLSTGLRVLQGDWKGAWEQMLKTVGSVVQMIGEHFINFTDTIKRLLALVIPIVVEWGIGLVHAMVEAVGRAIKVAVELFATAPLQIAKLSVVWHEAGQKIGEAMKEGIQSKLDPVRFATDPIGAVKNLFSSSSNKITIPENPFADIIRDLAFGVPDGTAPQKNWERHLKASEEFNKRRVENAEKAADEMKKQASDAAKALAEKQKALIPEFKDLYATVAEAITGNPLVKFFMDAEKAAAEAFEKFKPFGDGFARMASQMARAAGQAKLDAEVFELKFKALTGRQEAARLRATPATQTNGFQRILGTLQSALSIVRESVDATSGARSDRMMANGGAFMDQSFLQLRATVDRLQMFDSTAQRFDKIAQGLGGDLGEFGRLALAQAKLDLLPSSGELAELMRAGDSRTRSKAFFGLHQRAGFQDMIAKGADARLRDLLENNKFAEMARKQAQESVATVNAAIANARRSGKDTDISAHLDKILAVTGELGPGELTPQLRQARIDALVQKAATDENRSAQLQGLVQNLGRLLGPEGSGVPVKIKSGRHLVEIVDKTKGSVEVDSRGSMHDVDKFYGRRD